MATNSKSSNEDSLEFDQAIRKFFTICNKIMTKQIALSLNPSELYSITNQFNKYYQFYQKTEPQDRGFHQVPFKMMFEANKSTILLYHTESQSQFIDWLRKSGAVIKLGSHVPDFPNKDTQIDVSTIYNFACTMQEEEKKRIDSMPHINGIQYGEQYNYPDIFLYQLFKIFRTLKHDEESLVKINDCIQHLEKELNISTPSFANVGSTIFEACRSVASSAGLDTSKMPPKNEMISQINNLLGDGKLQSFIGTAVKSLANPENGGMPNFKGLIESLGQIAGSMPGMAETMTETLNMVVSGASSSTNANGANTNGKDKESAKLTEIETSKSSDAAGPTNSVEVQEERKLPSVAEDDEEIPTLVNE